jgi:hypothetical protein
LDRWKFHKGFADARHDHRATRSQHGNGCLRRGLSTLREGHLL